jgi:hypothetical protein
VWAFSIVFDSGERIGRRKAKLGSRWLRLPCALSARAVLVIAGSKLLLT